MDAKEVKACLKAARDAIRNKDFKAALNQCKVILTEDRNNYNALVFVGVATEGLNQPDQALKAYRRAAEQSPEQLLAWQGLSGMLEKNPLVMETAEAFSVFKKLESLNSTGIDKQIAYLHKLADLQTKSQETDKAVETLQSLIDCEKDEEQRMKAAKLLLSLLAPNAPKLSPTNLSLYKSTLNMVLKSSSLTPEDIHVQTERLLMLTTQTDVDNIERLSEELKQKFPNAISPFEFLLQCHLDKNIGVCPSSEACSRIKELTANLAALKEDSTLVKVGQGFLMLQDKNFSQARDLLKDIDSNSICGMYNLSQAHLRLHAYQQCLEACSKGLTACAASTRVLCVPVSGVMTWFRLLQAKTYREIGTAEAQDSGLRVLEEIQEMIPGEAFLIKAYIYLDQGKTEEAEDCFRHLANDTLPVRTLKAALNLNKGEHSKALVLLQSIVKEDPTDEGATLLLGKTLWELRDSWEIENAKQECFTTLLKAAKQDPYNHESFLYLGYFYKTIQQDLIKARRCFQKAYDLDPMKDETGCALVDILMDLGEESQALKVLEAVTAKSAVDSGKWAWLRLGLYQTKHEDPSVAIVSLQAAQRADPSDCYVWECLADAYLHRGSFTAALKAFTKASELDPESLYCLCRIASIKQTLGSLSEAIQEYKKVLAKSGNYVPALKGVGESLIQLGKQNLSRCLDGLAKDNFEEAVCSLTRAASQRPDMSCLWKLMGDSCTLIHCLSAESFSIPSKLVDKSSESNTKDVTKAEMLQIGSRCYTQAVKILQDSGALWHDLGVNLYYQSQLVAGNKESSGHSQQALALLQRAIQVIKKAVDLEPKDWRHWNVLGVLACSKLDHRPALAQHCFIKSLECEANNVVAWTNLGALYLSYGDIQLAHDAFKAAQSVDPTYMTSWVGQALIAEIVGHEDAMDLFRHTAELGFHPESVLGYGQWVLSVLGDSTKRDSEFFRYCIHQMAAVPSASDALNRYTGRIKTDPVAYNMQGLLFEHQNLLQSSVTALQKALAILEQNDPGNCINDVRMNLARVLCKHGEHEASVEQFELCDLSSSVEHTCLYGLALFRCGRLVDCFRVYQHALELLGDDPRVSQIYTALGMVAYKLRDMEEAKSQLFEGFKTSQPSHNGLLALCALGLLQKDMTLTSAVLQELFKRDDKDKYLRDILLLQVYKFIIEGDVEAGERHLRQAVEANQSVWSLLAAVILAQRTEQDMGMAKRASSVLDLLDSSAVKIERHLQSLCQLLTGHHHRLKNEKNALKTAQKAFHSNPGCKATLSTLVSAVHAESIIRRALTGRKDLFAVERGYLNILLRNGELSDELEKWCLQQVIVTCIEGNDMTSAQKFLKMLQEKKLESAEMEAFVKSVTLLFAVNDTALASTSYKLEILMISALYCRQRRYEEAAKFLQRCAENCDVQESGGVAKNLMERAAHLAYTGLQEQPDNMSLKKIIEDQVKYFKDKEIHSPVPCLLQAVIATKDNVRLAKHLFATALDQIDASRELGYCGSVVRQSLMRLLWDSTKESDQQLIQALHSDAKGQQDEQTLQFYDQLPRKK